MGNQMIDPALHGTPARIGQVVLGEQRAIGDGFTSLRFAEDTFYPDAASLLMVDHFVMSKPTFAPHLHAGMAVVTALFDDSRGVMRNRDTLGNAILAAGDLYWLTAGAGAAHETRPDDGARAHGLQIFIDLPLRLKTRPASALYVRAADVPVLDSAGHRVRVVLGASGDATGAEAPRALTLLDGRLRAGGAFVHLLPPGWHAWTYVVAGRMTVRVQGQARLLLAGQALAVGAGPASGIELESDTPTHFVLLAAPSAGAPAQHAAALANNGAVPAAAQ